MIIREGAIPKNAGQLKDQIGVAILNSPNGKFPSSVIDGKPYWDFEGIFFSIHKGIENVRRRLGNFKADQLQDMLAQAKAHYEIGEGRLGGPLLQDMQMVIMGRQPWAYPKEFYRWPLDPPLPELSEADLLNKGDEDD